MMFRFFRFSLLALLLLVLTMSFVSAVGCIDLTQGYDEINVSYVNSFLNETVDFKIGNCLGISSDLNLTLHKVGGEVVNLNSLTGNSLSYSFNMNDTSFNNSNLTLVSSGSDCAALNYTKIVNLQVQNRTRKGNFSFQSSLDVVNDLGLFNTRHDKQFVFNNQNFVVLNEVINFSLPSNYVSSSISVVDGVSGVPLNYTKSGDFINLSVRIAHNSTSFVNISFERQAVNVSNISLLCDEQTSTTGNCSVNMSLSNLLDVKLNDIPVVITDSFLDNFNIGLSDIVVKFNLVSGAGVGSYEDEVFSVVSSSVNKTALFGVFDCVGGYSSSGWGDVEVGNENPEFVRLFSNYSASNASFSVEVTNSSNRTLPDHQYSIGSISTTRDLGANSGYEFLVFYNYDLAGAGGSSASGGAGADIIVEELGDFAAVSFSQNTFDVFYISTPLSDSDRELEIFTNRELTTCQVDSDLFYCVTDGSVLRLFRFKPNASDPFSSVDEVTVIVKSDKGEALTISGRMRTLNLLSSVPVSIPFIRSDSNFFFDANDSREVVGLKVFPLLVLGLLLLSSLLYLFLRNRFLSSSRRLSFKIERFI